MIPYTLNDTGITFYLKGQKTFARDFHKFDQLKQAVIAGDAALVETLSNARAVIARISMGHIVISEDDEVLYKGTPVPEYLATRVLQHEEASEPVEPLLNFAGKLMENPNPAVREDLYRWVENGKMPIYPDGDFMAYKKVSANYTPIHQGGLYGQSQKIGEIVTQPRETCNENRNDTCSSGLHFCSYAYLPAFGYGGATRIIVLKINPRDVVSIPTDYNLTKGRTCRFEVVDEVPYDEIVKVFGDTMVIHSLGTYGETVEDLEGFDKDQGPADVAEFKNAFNYTAQDVWNALDEAKNVITAAAAQLGVGRSTLAGWIKKIGLPKETPEVLSKDELDEILDEIEKIDEDSWDDEESSWEDETAYNEFVESIKYVKTDPSVAENKLTKAQDAVARNGGNRTAAALELGIARSTLTRWLAGK